MRIRLISLPAAALLLLAGLVPLATAQDFRGTITGVVKDAQGAAVPGVSITVTNLATNVDTTVTSDDEGQYRVPYLISGRYSVKAELTGFATVLRAPIEVRVGDVIPVDVTLQLGAIEDVVEVTAPTPILNTRSGVTGQTIDSNQIQRLPLADGTAYMLTRLTAGVADSSDLHFSRPMDNGNMAGIVANGALGGNDFTLDGAPNRVSPNNTNPGNNSGVVGFSPPSDSIAEFQVQTNAFDAQAGQTSGAVVNLALKSGANDVHGAIGYFNRDDSRTETPLLSERAGAAKPTRDYNRFTATLSGPIVRNKTFFMVAYEYLRDVQPEPGTYTVPTLRMRQGDFSEWSDLVYDPRTATGSNNQRTPFPGNVIPAGRINPVAANYLRYWPEPNQPGLEDNYFSNQLRPYDYDAVLGRIDHDFGGNRRLFVSGYWNKRQENRYDWAGEVDGFAVTRGFDFRSNTGATIGYTATRGSHLLFDVRAGYSRFGEWRDPAETFDPASLGFSSTAAGLMGDYAYLPLITFSNFNAGTNANSRIATLGAQRSDYGEGFERPFYNVSFAPTVTYLRGDHSMRFGYELRYRRWDIDSSGYGAGRYDFTGAYTRANNSAPTAVLPQMFAQFLLGLPTTSTNTVANPGSSASQFEIAASGQYSQTAHGLFVQDDWRVSPRLTLNLGVRLEVERAMTEAENRNLAGFDPLVSSPIEAAARAAYARNPIPEIPVSEFAVKGGVLFADGPIYNTLVKVLPRAALSYLIDDKTVLRGGAGLFSYPYYFDAGNQSGFSQPTGVITTTNNGATFLTDLSDPLPGGALIQPPGASLGAGTSLGLTLGTIVPPERKSSYYARWQIGFQRDLGAGWVVELVYLGSRGTNLPVVRELNGIPFEYLSTSPTRDTALESYLSAQVPNPFQGMLPGTGMNGATIQRGQLLRLYPQFLGGSNNGTLLNALGNIGVGGTASVATEEYVGSDSYHAGTIRVEKRFRNGNSLLATYTRSRARDEVNYLNPSDPNAQLEDRISPNDRPNRFTAGVTFAFPFGRGQKWGSDWSGATNAILGGWRMSASYQYQTGFPLTWNTSLYYDPDRDPKDLKSNIGEKTDRGIAGLDYPAWDTSGFYVPGGTGTSDPRIQLGNNVRYFPSTLPDVRSHDLHLLDVGLYKDFLLPREAVLQLRVEAINALNYTVLWNPTLNPRQANFGLVTQDRNNPRDIQLAVRLTF